MKSHKNTYVWMGILGVIVASIILLWPLSRNGFFITDDGDWMIIRLSAFYQSLVGGQFPVRFLGRLNHNYGYPVANFLYPGFLYVGSVIRLFGFTYVDVVKILLALSIVGSGSFLFVTLKKKYDTLSSLGGAISFILSPYVFFDLYKRGSVGELFAFLPVSMLLFGIMADVLWIIPIATALLIVSHNSLALLFMGVSLIFAAVSGKPWLYIKGMVIGIGMATFFWLPALYERQYVLFDSTRISDPLSYFVTMDNWQFLGAGVIAALFILVSKTYTFNFFEKVSAVITLGSVFFALSVSTIIWKWVPMLASFIQFPYRFLSIASIVGAFSVSAVFSVVPKKSKMIIFLILIFVLVYTTVLEQRSIAYVDHGEGYYSTNEATTTVKNEFMPTWVQVIPIKRASQKVTTLSGNATFVPDVKTPQHIDGILDVKSDSLIQINTIYYPGWGVTLDGILTPVIYTNPYGLMQFFVEKGRYRLEASFRETGFRLITDIISFAFGVTYILWMIKFRHRS